MSVEIPKRTIEKLNEAKLVSERLLLTARKNQKTWSREQEEQLSLIFEMMKGIHAALVNLVEAN